MGLPSKLTDSLKEKIPEMIQQISKTNNLKDSIYKIDFEVTKVDNENMRAKIIFGNQYGKGVTYNTNVKGNYDSIYMETKNKLDKKTVNSYPIAKLKEEIKTLL